MHDCPLDLTLLEEARLLWFASRMAARDARLRVGALLADFLGVNLAIGGLMDEADRIRHGLTRSALTLRAAKALDTPRRDVNDLMHVSAGVRLLSDGGEIGGLSYTALRALRVLVERPPGRAKRSRKGSVGPTPLEQEAWRVKEPAEANTALFRRAVGEGWDAAEAASAMPACLTGPPRGRNRNDGTCLPSGPDVFALARAGTPKDVADLVLRLILANPEAQAVRELVAHGLAARVPEKITF